MSVTRFFASYTSVKDQKGGGFLTLTLVISIVKLLVQLFSECQSTDSARAP